MGCDVLDRRAPGIPLLRAEQEGFRLAVECNGTRFSPPGKDALAAAAAWLADPAAIPAFHRSFDGEI